MLCRRMEGAVDRNRSLAGLNAVGRGTRGKVLWCGLLELEVDQSWPFNADLDKFEAILESHSQAVKSFFCSHCGHSTKL